MNGQSKAQIIAELEEMDADYLVDVLDISSSELLDMFPIKVLAYANAFDREFITDEVEDDDINE